MGADKQGDSKGFAARKQHPHVTAQLKAAQRAQERPGVKLAGLLADHPTRGMRSLYLNRDLSRRVDFKVADVQSQREIPAGEPPFTDFDGVLEIRLKPGAEARFLSFREPPHAGDWDLDTQLGASTRVRLEEIDDYYTSPVNCDPLLTGMRPTCRCKDGEIEVWLGDPEF